MTFQYYRCSFLVALFFAFLFLETSQVFGAGPPPVRIVYFVPNDREPCEDYENRLDRVMTEIQEFYRRGMEKNGLGPKTFALERTDEGKLKIYHVNGKEPMLTYGRNSYGVVRREVEAVMWSEYNIDIQNEVIVIFQVLLEWKDGIATEIGSYVGSGTSRSGTAWVYDDALLDAALLSSKEPGGYYHGHCSIGKFNSHYIGGVAHEMGHAFSLPHDRESDEERRTLGTSLMGSGNHTYGTDLRDEGRGTFLSAASAYRLENIRAFSENFPSGQSQVTCTFEGLVWESRDGKLSVRGTVNANPPITAVIAYNDNGNIPSDYDALTSVFPLNQEDRRGKEKAEFHFEFSSMQPGPWQLRLVACHNNGSTTTLPCDYQVGDDGNVNVDELNILGVLKQLRDAFLARNQGQLGTLIEEATRKYPNNEFLGQRVNLLISLQSPKPPIALADVPEDQKTVHVADLIFTEASLGWGQVCRNFVPEDVFIQVAGRFYDSGLFAHAPSLYVIPCEGQWSKFTFEYGMQDGHPGTVVFVVRGDGKELFRSRVIRQSNRPSSRELDITGIQRLELAVEETEDGRSFDWAVWLNPKLER